MERSGWVGQCDQNRSLAKSNPATNGIADYNSVPALTKNAPERNLQTSFQLILITRHSPNELWFAAERSRYKARRLLPAGFLRTASQTAEAGIVPPSWDDPSTVREVVPGS